MTRRGLQRALLGGVLAVSAAASLWWMGTVPYRPRAVLDAVPEQAAWVSLHASPAARWPDLRSNSLVRALARLETLAKERGTAVGVASALPISIERIGSWAKQLEGRGLTLVPLTTAMLKPKSS